MQAIFAVTFNALPAQGMGAGGIPRTLERFVQPQVGCRDELLARKNQRHARALRHWHASFLQ